MNRHLRRGTRWDRPDRVRTTSFCGGPVRRHSAKPTGIWSGSYDRLRWRPVVTERREGSDDQLARNAFRRRPKPERDQRHGGGGLDR